MIVSASTRTYVMPRLARSSSAASAFGTGGFLPAMSRPVSRVAVSTPMLAFASAPSSTVIRSEADGLPASMISVPSMSSSVPPVLLSSPPRPARLPTWMTSSPAPASTSVRVSVAPAPKVERTSTKSAPEPIRMLSRSSVPYWMPWVRSSWSVVPMPRPVTVVDVTSTVLGSVSVLSSTFSVSSPAG